ncbi:NAD-dependent epimerase/dehydratase family protein [Brevibacillus ginsengisoli]|uniref:NAD-dependent epimerase/dehydratase family protein n=1 Tax=Brevibacillus ginsengisoli TaxID=363854 RepID=UPI003CED0C61
MKSALVLGGTQFFGKHLVQDLLEKGVNVTIATRGTTPDPFGNQVERLRLNRESRETIAQAAEAGKWDVLYDQTCYSPQEAQDVMELFSGKIKRYIFTSTMAVYDFAPARKETDFDPYSFGYTLKTRKEYPGLLGYQEAKRAAEAVLFQQAPFDVVAVRFPLVVGPDDYTNRFTFHTDRIKQGLPIGIDQPDERYSFISSADAGRFLSWIGDTKQTGPFNAGCEADISMAELIKRMEASLGKKATIITNADPTDRSPYALPASLSIDTTKARAAGFTFETLDSLLGRLLQTK